MSDLVESDFGSANPVLILIDVQNAFLDEAYWGGNRNNKDAEQICGQILQKWRDKSLPVIHVRHSSTDENSKLHHQNAGFEFNEHAKPRVGEPIITKQVNSGFIGTELKSMLDQQNASTLVIVGLTTDHCVSTTTRMAGNFGYKTYLISDATATFDRVGTDGEVFLSDVMHKTALASLNGEFATVLTHQSLFELL